MERHVVFQRAGSHRGQRHRAPARISLRRADVEPPLDLHDLLSDLDAIVEEVDAPTPQAHQLAPAEPSIRRHEHQRLEASYDPIDDLPALMRASHPGDWPATETVTITSARMPTPEEAAALAMSDGVPLLVVCVAEHTTGKHELPLYVLEYCWPADRYEFHEPTAHSARS